MEGYELTDLSFTYPGQGAPALSQINLTVAPGEFITLCGPSGCGKTTLLRQLKPALAPHGQRTGRILFQGAPLEELAPPLQAAQIGFVLQSPEEQIVTDKVWHELAFGLENLGLNRDTIRARVAETASFFGMEPWFHQDTASLSGGQKQLLNLAAVMVMGPKVLLLDEPTSQLDPVAARHFLDCLARLNRELGTTILLSEHRLEDALPLSHRCAVLDGGRLLTCEAPELVGTQLKAMHHPMFRAMPTPMRVWAATREDTICPLTVAQGRTWIKERAATQPFAPLPPLVVPPQEEPVLVADEVWFRYERQGEDVLRGLSLAVPRGSLFALLGGNGAGKTTLLALLTAAQQPQRGDVSLLGRQLSRWPVDELFHGTLAVLPQDVKALFVGQRVMDDLLEMTEHLDFLHQTTSLCRLDGLLERHPYDLSGGEQQRAALAKVLLTRPKILLLDEPTKGMDAPFKEVFAAVLADLRRDGLTILMVSHDVEFCAQYATHCALLFDGTITASGQPRPFFSQNRFYTTAACRMAGEFVPDAVTAPDLIIACGGEEVSPTPSTPLQSIVQSVPAPVATKEPKGRVSRLLGGALLALTLFVGVLAWQGVPALSGLASGQWLPSVLVLAVAALALWLLGLGRPSPRRPHTPASNLGSQRGSWITALCLLVLVPATLLAGTYLLGDRKYYFIALLLLFEGLFPLFLSFERSKPRARYLVVLAILTALAVAGRGAFFMLPQFKPLAAVAILAGVAFGGQAGFLVGACSMLVSNFFYVQGAWTPWQMAAMGLVGLLAGWLAPWLGRGRLPLCLYGFSSVILLFGGLMNPASVLMYQPHPSWEMIVTSWVLGFPLDLVHGAATAFFLWAGGPALLDKLERVKVKYGLNGRS